MVSIVNKGSRVRLCAVKGRAGFTRRGIKRVSKIAAFTLSSYLLPRLTHSPVCWDSIGVSYTKRGRRWARRAVKNKEKSNTWALDTDPERGSEAYLD